MKLLIYFIVLIIISLTETTSMKSQYLSSSPAPIYSIFLQTPAQQRYSLIIKQKHLELTKFIQYLYNISLFKYSFYLAKILFMMLPQNMIRNFLTEEFYDQCKGIAKYSKREVYEIVVYNYMYQIGSVKNFCTSIAYSQYDKNINMKNINNLSILARNLDYGFQQFLSSNTIQINFYQSQQHGQNKFNLKYTIITHAGFVGSHTIFKYTSSQSQSQSSSSQSQKSSQSSQLQLKNIKTHGSHDIKFALSLNQRSSQHLIINWINVLFFRCESIFQLLNRVLKQQNQNLQSLVDKLVKAKQFYFIYFHIQYMFTCLFYHSYIKQTKCVNIKKLRKGAQYVQIQKITDNKNTNKPYYILQTNTDHDLPDPDGRRDIARNKIQTIIKQKGYLQRDQLKSILLESPNFNQKTLMTAIIDVENQIIQTIVWGVKSKQ